MLNESRSAIAMWNRDILFEIATRVSLDMLRHLIVPEIWDELKQLLEKSSFWHTRIANALGHPSPVFRSDVDWKRVYFSMFRISEASSPHIAGLDYLPSLMAITEVFGEPAWNEEMWFHISDPAVLEYVTNERLIEVSQRGIVVCLIRTAETGRTEMVEPLIDHLDPEEMTEADRVIALTGAISGKHLSTLDALILNGIDREIDSPGHIEVIVDNAVRSGSWPILRRVLLRFEYDEDSLLTSVASADDVPLFEHLVRFGVVDLDLQEFAEVEVMEAGAVNILRHLLEKGEVDFSTAGADWNEMLLRAIHHNRDTMVQLLLRLSAGEELDGHGLVRTTLLTGHGPTLWELLQDERIDVTSRIGTMSALDIASLLLTAYPGETTPESIHRVSLLSALEREDANLLIWLLEPEHVDKVRGYALASDLVRSILGVDMDESDGGTDELYLSVLRYIFESTPDSTELLDWMTREDNERIAILTRAVLERTPVTSREAPICALLSCLLYPTITLEGLIDRLRDEGARPRDVLRAARLVGAHRGAS